MRLIDPCRRELVFKIGRRYSRHYKYQRHFRSPAVDKLLVKNHAERYFYNIGSHSVYALVYLVTDTVADFIQIICVGRNRHDISVFVSAEFYQIGISHSVGIKGFLDACRCRRRSRIPRRIIYKLFSHIGYANFRHNKQNPDRYDKKHRNDRGNFSFSLQLSHRLFYTMHNGGSGKQSCTAQFGVQMP